MQLCSSASAADVSEKVEIIGIICDRLPTLRSLQTSSNNDMRSPFCAFCSSARGSIPRFLSSLSRRINARGSTEAAERQARFASASASRSRKASRCQRSSDVLASRFAVRFSAGSAAGSAAAVSAPAASAPRRCSSSDLSSRRHCNSSEGSGGAASLVLTKSFTTSRTSLANFRNSNSLADISPKPETDGMMSDKSPTLRSLQISSSSETKSPFFAFSSRARGSSPRLLISLSRRMSVRGSLERQARRASATSSRSRRASRCHRSSDVLGCREATRRSSSSSSARASAIFKRAVRERTSSACWICCAHSCSLACTRSSRS
mmetsp:Transcript_134038/g.250797  ORF Transcript_134038/g.250797 Transcript_134038/m.250797 type:complete len:320 (-) Transcript_134038:2403-3362(-)